MSYVALAVGVGTAGYKIYDSVHKSNQAKKLAAANKRPVFNADGSIQDVLDLATSEVNNRGLEDFASRNLGQNLASGIDAMLKSGGRPDYGVISQQYGTQMRAALEQIKKSRAYDVAGFNAAAYNKAKAADASFMYNKDAPYKDTKQNENLLREEAEASKMDAVGALATGAANYGIMNTMAGQYGQKQTAFTPQRATYANPVDITSSSLERQPGNVIAGPTNNALLAAAGRVTPNNYVSASSVNSQFQYPTQQQYGRYTDEFGQFVTPTWYQNP